MSNIRQSDVKNHLSPRFRKKIFLSPFELIPDAASLPQPQPVGTEPKADSMASSLNLSSASGRKPVASAISPGIKR